MTQYVGVLADSHGDRGRRPSATPWDLFDEIIHEEQPYTFLYYLNERLGVAQRLRGVGDDARRHLVSVQDWWIAAG
ncbi:MAG: hypothetical protein WD766_14385 [Gemmatimonadota bacterium]